MDKGGEMKEQELTEADRKAIDERAKYEWPSMQAMFKHGAEWGIKHARANDDPGPEWVASNILEGAAKRIKELEAENARHVAINSLLSGDEPEVKLANRVFELEAEVSRLTSERDEFERRYELATKPNNEELTPEQRIELREAYRKGGWLDEPALQSPSSAKDTPDTYPSDLSEADIKWIKATEVEYANTVSQFPLDPMDDFGNGLIQGIKYVRQSSHVSVDPTIEGDFAMWTKDKLKQWYYDTYIKLDLKFEELKTLAEMEQMIASGDFEYKGHIIKLASPVSVDINRDELEGQLKTVQELLDSSLNDYEWQSARIKELEKILREAVLWCGELKPFLGDPSRLQEFIDEAVSKASSPKQSGE